MNTPTVSQMKGLVDTAQGLLDRQIFFSQEIYQQEPERIFARCWLYLGHKSQIPNPNDFLATYTEERSRAALSGPAPWFCSIEPRQTSKRHLSKTLNR